MDFHSAASNHYGHRKRGRSPSPASHSSMSGSYGGSGGSTSSHRYFDHSRSKRSSDRGEKRSRSSFHSQPVSVSELAMRPSFLTLRDFLEYQDSAIQEHEAIKIYSQYKDLYISTKLNEFFESHKSQKWFLERYNAAEQTRVQSEVMKLMEVCNDSFLKDLAAGAFEGLCLDEAMQAGDEKGAFETSTETPEANLAAAATSSDEAIESSAATASPEAQNGNNKSGDLPSLKMSFCDFTKLKKLFLKSIPSSLSRQQLVESIKKITEFKAVLLSEISPEKNFTRDGWIYIDEGADLNKVFESFPNGMLKVDSAVEIEVGFANAFPTPKIRYAPSISNTEERLRKDYELALGLLKKLSKDNQISVPFEADPVEPAENGPLSTELAAKVKKTLDMMVVFLRRVFFFCFYCGIQTECPDEMVRKCGHSHIRKASCMKSQAYLTDWVQEHESRICAKSQTAAEMRPVCALLKADTKSVDQLVQGAILKLEEAKFKCDLCTKLFKGPEFVEKHIRLKHPEKLHEFEAEDELYRSFIVDPMALSFGAPFYMNAAASSSSSLAHTQASMGTAFHDHSSSGSHGGRHHERHAGRSESLSYQSQRSRHEQPTDRRNPYEGRRLKTYADLDAPVLEDVDLQY